MLFFGQQRIDAIKQCCDKWVGTQRLGAAVVTRDGYVPHTQCGAGLAPVVVVLLLLLVLPVVAYEMRLEFLQQQQEQLELGHNMWQAFAVPCLCLLLVLRPVIIARFCLTGKQCCEFD